MELKSLNEPTNIAIFYHGYFPTTDISILTSQLELLDKSGIYNAVNSIFFNISTTNDIEQLLQKYPKINYHIQKEPFLSECPTLKILQDDCSAMDNVQCLYFHSKGSHHVSKQTIAWRKYMEHFLIQKWEDTISLLQIHDTVGVDFKSTPSPHYAGNFWWANKKAITTANKVDTKLNHDRFKWEFWILSGEASTHPLHDSGVNLYVTPYEARNYIEQKETK